MEFVLFFAVLIALSLFFVPMVRRNPEKRNRGVLILALFSLFYLIIGGQTPLFSVGLLLLCLMVILVIAT